MATVLTDDQHYINIADSIRAKNGTANTYTPAQMSAAIDAISGGGSTLGTKTITANGTYAASSDSLDGYSSVTVSVPQGTNSGSTPPTSEMGSDGDYYVCTHELPSDVSFVEYLESSGTQYIDTELTANEGTDFYCKLTFLGDYHAFGVRTGAAATTSRALMVGPSTVNLGALKSTDPINAIDYKPSATVGNVYELGTKTVRGDTYYDASLMFDGEPMFARTKQSTFTSDGSMIAFGARIDGSVSVGTAKIYRLVIYQDGEPIRDYLPCLDGNGVACMWDNVAAEYVYNDGTGDFTYGSTVTPDALDATLYKKVSGTWTVIA